MNNTEKHADLCKSLLDVLQKFHEENEDLHVHSVYLNHFTNGLGREYLTGLTVEMNVQPSEEPK